MNWVIECEVFGEGWGSSSWNGTVSAVPMFERAPTYLGLSGAI
jgi:hypothetical protein